MTDIFGNPERKGDSGRIPNSKREKHQLYQKFNVSLEPTVFERLCNFCDDQERARSWVIKVALDEWLEKNGY